MVYLYNKNKRFSKENSKDILIHLRSMFSELSNIEIEIRDVRISSYFIEVDLSLYETDDLNNANLHQIPSQISSIFNSFSSILNYEYLIETKQFLTKESVLDNAIFLFNIERFWKSHEILEGIWKESQGMEKRVLNGLILIDAAFVHFQKDEMGIFVSILNRSLEKLKESNGKFYNINLDEIKNSLNKIVDSHNYDIFKIMTY
jgi:predicted metal-dependent hydrolase